MVATNVATGSREHREIAHAAALIGEDYHDRFLIELIQNANDQAILGGVRDSTVLVVRSEKCIAVSNGGQVVTERNLERITSLADSDKTGLLVGNKGVGFKAVYQVTDAPEVYSGAEGEPQASVFDSLALGVALERWPFEDPAITEAVEHDIRSFFAENEGLARFLENAGHDDPVEAVRPELEKVAGFKFPLPRTAEDLARRADELQIPPELRADVRTLVLLPLRDETASATAEKAIDRLVGAQGGERAQAELAVLFLRGVDKLFIIDQVRGQSWSFSCVRSSDDAGMLHATVEVSQDGDERRSTEYWLIGADVFDADAATASQRRAVVDQALERFSLEAWSADDPLHVTVALPKPRAGNEALDPAGRFCLGLPTEQSTGLTAHVDARFFAKINRDGVKFDQMEGYNELLLDVATEAFGLLLERLRASDSLSDRRAATLALHRPPGAPGALAERVYAEGGIADGEVVLAWGGDRYLTRTECLVPHAAERDLLPLLDDALSEIPIGVKGLPERGLLLDSLDALETMGLSMLGDVSPHPWLVEADEVGSVVERAAARHRSDGPVWWEPFVSALLDAFESDEIMNQRWIPIGAAGLSSASARVFLPTSADSASDDEEIATVPPHIAATLRVVDPSAMRLRDDRGALTPLATCLVDEKLVRRPRLTELLNDALLPGLAKAARRGETTLALDLFSQAVAWIGSMKEASRSSLNRKHAVVPTLIGEDVRWVEPGASYLGPGWGLAPEEEQRLAAAYPEDRLMPLSMITPQLGHAAFDAASAREAALILGVNERPRILALKPNNNHPLMGFRGKLTLQQQQLTVGRPELDAFFTSYLRNLAQLGTTAAYTMAHGVERLLWIDGLEDEAQRPAVLALMLAYPDHYVTHATTVLRRQNGRVEHPSVPQLWAFALASLSWPIVPAERGVGGEAIRVPANECWLLSDSHRRSAFAKLINVLPQQLAPAWPLLHQIGVSTVDKAPRNRLVAELAVLAGRLQREHLEGSRDALSLARELYTQIEDREASSETALPSAIQVPLLRGGKLVATSPGDTEARVLFDDDPGRTRYVEGADTAFRVPVGRDAKIDELHSMFVATWGSDRVIRSSTAEVDLGFISNGATPQPFLAWLQESFPRSEVAVDLAVMLTLGSDRTLRSERISRNWRLFRELHLDFGAFAASEVESFYDRSVNLLQVSSSVQHDPASIVAATWELAGVRSKLLWRAYAAALREQPDGNTRTRAFLRDQEITEVDIVDVADAAGLHRVNSVESLECALLALHRHLGLGTDLNDAATWWAHVEHNPSAVAISLGHPDLTPEIASAVLMQQPEGELHLMRHTGVPWATWQEAVLRRDGRIYSFEKSVARFRVVTSYLVALVRELAVRDRRIDLDQIDAVLDDAIEVTPPDSVVGVPPDAAPADHEALNAMLTLLRDHPSLHAEIASLAEQSWDGDLPMPETRKATQRGVALYRSQSVANREIEASSSVRAVLAVASLLAPTLNEGIIADSLGSDSRLVQLTTGVWANVYAALSALRDALLEVAPETTARLSAIGAFRKATRLEPLLAALPELATGKPINPPPKQQVLGLELAASDVRDDLAAGSNGALGSKLALAATDGLDPNLIGSSRSPLPEPQSHSGSGSNGGDGVRAGTGYAGKPVVETALIGDLGEAFVHEWLSYMLEDGYGAECWRSSARERYGLPDCGDDNLGYDFEVPDPAGRLFKQSADSILIEVKSTSTDGSGSFPMSRHEWDVARRCHENGTLYVIVRVFSTLTAPRIGDVLIDPFAAHLRGELRLSERDLWITVAPPRRAVL